MGLLFYLHRGIMVGRRTALAEFFLMAGLAAVSQVSLGTARVSLYSLYLSPERYGSMQLAIIGSEADSK